MVRSVARPGRPSHSEAVSERRKKKRRVSNHEAPRQQLATDDCPAATGKRPLPTARQLASIHRTCARLLQPAGIITARSRRRANQFAISAPPRRAPLLNLQQLSARKSAFRKSYQCMSQVRPDDSHFSLSFYQKIWFMSRIPPRREGVARNRHDTWSGMRWRVGLGSVIPHADEQGGCGREVVWSRRPGADAKPADVDASVAATGAIKPVPEESAYKR
jgi:hypothetical protein